MNNTELPANYGKKMRKNAFALIISLACSTPFMWLILAEGASLTVKFVSISGIVFSSIACARFLGNITDLWEMKKKYKEQPGAVK